MNGFGFIEYEDHMDARDVVPGEQGLVFSDMRLTGIQLSVRFPFDVVSYDSHYF